MKEIAFDQDKYYPAVEPEDSAKGQGTLIYFLLLSFEQIAYLILRFLSLNISNDTGELRNIAANKCVDTQFKESEKKFGLRKCISDDPTNTGEQVSDISLTMKLFSFLLITSKYWDLLNFQELSTYVLARGTT